MNDNLKCPYCSSEFTEQIDYDFETQSEKRRCIECCEDYIVWWDENKEEVIEVTDRHNIKIEDGKLNETRNA